MSTTQLESPCDPDGDRAWARLDERHPMRRKRRRVGIATVVILVIGAAEHAIIRGSGAAALAASLLSLWVVWIASIVLHELGHTLGARATRLRPFLLIAGAGPSLVLREVRGVAIDIGILPGDGFTLLGSDAAGPGIKWRLLVSYASGPIVSAALLSVGLVAFPGHLAAFLDGTATWISPATALVLVNALLVFSSVVPMPRPSDVISCRNDLSQIVMLPRMKPRALEGLVKAARGATFFRLFFLRKYRAAYLEGRRQLALDPSNWGVRIQLADMLIFSGRHAEAAVEYGILREEPALVGEGAPPLVAAMLENNFAWLSFLLGGGEALESAELASSKAFAAAPNNPHIVGTRGAVLIAKGNVEEGRALVERALKLHKDAHSRASCYANLALASAELGQHDEARRLLKRALRLDPDCDLASRAQRRLSAHCPP